MSPRPSKRLHVKPSGWAFIVVGLLVQLAAWNTGTNLLYLVAGCVFAFVAVGAAIPVISLRRVRLSREVPSAIHRGEPYAITQRIENLNRFAPAISVRIKTASEKDSDGAYISAVHPRGKTTVRIEHIVARRGVYAFPPMSGHSAFPLGLFERSVRVDDGATITVYPSVHAVRMGMLEQMHGTGDTPKLRRGDGDEFFSLRDYVMGDDPRKIAWKVSARVGRLIVRELEPSTSHNIVVLLDTVRPPGVDQFDDLFEEAVDLAASLVVSFLNRQYAVGLLTPDGFEPIGEGNSHATRILETLARVKIRNDGSGDWTDSEMTAGAGVVYVSGDPANWGAPSGVKGVKFLDPREVIRA